jgi:hypothetical protein
MKERKEKKREKRERDAWLSESSRAAESPVLYVMPLRTTV